MSVAFGVLLDSVEDMPGDLQRHWHRWLLGPRRCAGPSIRPRLETWLETGLLVALLALLTLLALLPRTHQRRRMLATPTLSLSGKLPVR